MGADRTVVRRISGTAAAVLLLAVLAVLVEVRTTTPGAYQVDAVLGRAGSGLASGGEVKLRGVVVGRVLSVATTERGAVATLELRPEPRLPNDVRAAVSAKTLLGEKQLELRTASPLDPPYLAAGDTVHLEPGQEVVEVGAVIDGLAGFFAAVDPDSLAAFVDAAGAFDLDDAARFGEAIDTSAELSELLRRTGPDQVARFGDAADAFDALADAAPDLTALAHSLPGAVAPIVASRGDLRATSEALTRLAAELGPLLTTEEPTIRALLRAADEVGRVLDPRMAEIGRYLHGIYRYSVTFGQQGGPLTDGSEYALFRVFVGDAGQFGQLCEQLPDPLRDAAPGCAVAGRPAP